MENNRRKWNVYSILIPFFPIFTLYGFNFLPYITFSDYFLLFFVIKDIIENKINLICKKGFGILITYLLVQPFLLLAISEKNYDFFDAAGTAWKLALYIFSIPLLTKRICAETAIKSVRFIGITSTIYGYLQFFLGTYVHVSLSPYLPFFPILRTGLDTQQADWIALNWVVRPRAWFSEPSTFAIFLVMALLIELFLMEQGTRKKFLCFLYAFGIIISRSSTGVFALIILIFTWLITCPEEFLYKIPKNIIISGIIVLPICVVLLYKGGYVDSFVGHTFVNGQGLSSQSHFAYIGGAFSINSNFWNILIGHGMQDVETGYLPGWIRTYYCLGIVGFFLFLGIFWKVLRTIPKRQKVIVLTFMALNLGTEIMLGVFMLLYMSVALILDTER